MRAPEFWWDESPGLTALILSPAGSLWGAVSARRMQRDGNTVDVPVICAGNFVAGGAGKTPTAMACAAILLRRGFKPAFLTRGYGGSLSRSGTPVRVDSRRHSALQTGDEPLLLARIAPTIVAADRVAGARAAVALGSDVLVMDDGLQNPALRKSCAIAIVDGESGIGNGLCIPAGPLRAPMEIQLQIIDALLVIGDGAAGERIAGRALSHGKSVFKARLVPDQGVATQIRNQKVVAFAGIGRPAKFFATLEETGAEIVEAFAFGDHQKLNGEEIATLVQSAQANEALLVTTEKDLVRIGDDFGAAKPLALPVKLQLDDEGAFENFLLTRVRLV